MAAMGSRLGQRAGQRQAPGLTPALQQSIKLLQLSGPALAELLAEAVAENPLLEWAEAPPPALRKPRPRARASFRPLPKGLTRLFAGVSRQRAAPISGETNEVPAGGPSLQDHLLQQLGADIAEAGDRVIGRALIEALDEAGYLTLDPADIALRLKAEPGRMQRILARLQQFDPPGVFARDLGECLALQLADRGRLDGPMTVLLQHLDLLAAGDRKALMARCGVDAVRLSAMIDELRRLDPRPGLVFDQAIVAAIVPDLSIEAASGGGWSIELNSEPHLTLSERHPLPRSSDVAAHDYLKERRAAARWLLRALDRRSETLLRVAHEIVARQAAFLTSGVAALKPLSRREIARKLELHESTVSRATANKYAATPRGVVALSDFFAGRLPMGDGANHAPAAVRARLQRLIAAEPAGKPLSDEALARLLREERIGVARRTVAKYREMLRIPPSSRRRRGKTL
jgi:RNA polymerase sigma-54 factor